MILKERLIKLRKELGLSKKEIAEKLNVEQSTYGKYELGKRQPSLEILLKITEIFGVSADYLLGLTDKTTVITEELETQEFSKQHQDSLDIEISKLSPEKRKQAEDFVRFLKTEEEFSGELSDISLTNDTKPQHT